MKRQFFILLTLQIAIITAGGSSCCKGNHEQVRIFPELIYDPNHSSIPDKGIGRYDSDKEFLEEPLIEHQQDEYAGSAIFLAQESWKKLYPLEPVFDPDIMLFEKGEDLIMQLETKGLRKKWNKPDKLQLNGIRDALKDIQKGLADKDYTNLFNDLFNVYDKSPIFRWKPRLYAVLVTSVALRSESQWQTLSPPDAKAVLFKNEFGLVLKQHGNDLPDPRRYASSYDIAMDHIQDLLRQRSFPELFQDLLTWYFEKKIDNDLCRVLLEEIVLQMDEHQIKLKLGKVTNSASIFGSLFRYGPKDKTLIDVVKIGIPKILSIFMEGKNFKKNQLDEALKYIVEHEAEKGYREMAKMAKILQKKGANARIDVISKKLEDLRTRRKEGCCICFETHETMQVRDCDHLVCENCEKHYPTVNKPCPICRENGDESRPSAEYNHKRKKLEEMKKALDVPVEEDYKEEPRKKSRFESLRNFFGKK